ncbi:MAG TPA: alpha/beta hydrolase [Chitinophagaceae bacterium]|nr:alpha/beta hydrolase [Chitinophagaceae bacterium]
MEERPDFEEHFINVPGARIHYLDWGGSGETLILIHGVGDSPYIFLELAASLKDKYRVIAYSRRGHCKSKTTDQQFDNATLVSDLNALLDGLKISKANLLGWSMGGNEITEFAIRYPEKTNKLIYLEAGYDLSDQAFKDIIKTIPKSPFPDIVDLKNINDYRTWYHKFWLADVEWNSALEANLTATTAINADGSVGTIPNDSITQQVMAGMMAYHRDYKKIQAPALAFYTKKFFVPPVNDKQIVLAYEAMEKNIISPWRQRNIAQIRSELKNITIKELPAGSHTSLIFLSKEPIIESINSFLLN